MSRFNQKPPASSATPLFVVVTLLASAWNSNALVAQDDAAAKDDPTKKPKVEMLECNVKVIDPDGHPIEDATVFCTGLRSKEEPGSHWGWREDQLGKAPKIKTNAQGIAKMPYPKMLSDEHTTGKMTWSVMHPDFANYRSDHSVDEDPAEVSMERGFRIALTAVRASSGEKIKDNLHAVASFAGGGKWELKTNGMLVSSVMKKQNGIMRVVCFEDDKPTLFSDEIEIKPGDKSRVLLKDIHLSLGCRVEGRIDDTVTRPIENGYVIACISKQPNPANRRSSWHWSDEAKINQDGTFVFESLPADEAVQMLPICDGWVPAKPKAEEVFAALRSGDPAQFKNKINAFSATPQVFRTDEEETTVALEMVKAATVTVKVVDQNGEPLENIKTGTAPNQYWFNSGSQILGNSYPTRLIWQLQLQWMDLRTHQKFKRQTYFGTTGKDGIIRFKNMPPGGHDVGVYDEDWEMQKDPESGDLEKRIQVEGSDQSITIRLLPKGTAPKEVSDSQPPAAEPIVEQVKTK